MDSSAIFETDVNYSLDVEFQGSFVKAAVKNNGYSSNIPITKRSVINSFSARSRKRLLERFARLDTRGVDSKFITLTYPASFPDAKIAKNQLRAFFERLRRRFPNSSGIWRLEFQQRGAPHFHIIMFNMPYLPFHELRNMWCEIIGHPPDQPLFVRIEQINSHRKVMSYASKYVAKVDDSGEGSTLFNYVPYLHAGRWWGVFNGDFLPFAELKTISISGDFWRIFHQFRRYAARGGWRGVCRLHRDRGFSLFRNSDPWLKLFQHCRYEFS